MATTHVDEGQIQAILRDLGLATTSASTGAPRFDQPMSAAMVAPTGTAAAAPTNVVCNAIDLVIPILEQLEDKAHGLGRIALEIVIRILKAYRQSHCGR